MKSKLFYLFILTLLVLNTNAQVSYYFDTFKGGLTGGGYAPANDGSGTGTINVHIFSGSTIRKAYLFTGRHGLAANLTVQLSGNPVIFNSSNQVSPSFQSIYGGTSGVHAMDVTSFISASVNTYSLVVPAQSSTSDRYTDFYLFIAYQDTSLPAVSTEFFVNDKDFNPAINYTFNLTHPVNTAQPVALGLHLGYLCDNSDTSRISVNGSLLGTVYGPESNSGSCGGPFANFYYENNNLWGLGDDNANLAMSRADVLSNVQTVIPDSSSSFTMNILNPRKDNSHWGFFIISSGVCSLPTANALPADTTVCNGSMVQLVAGGGTTYRWSPGRTLSDSTISNPITFASGNITYTVTVGNSCGSATSAVHIAIFPAPPIPTIIHSNDTLYCSTDPSYVSYQWFLSINPIIGASTPVCIITEDGNYNVVITDTNGCSISVGINIVNVIPKEINVKRFTVAPNPAMNEICLPQGIISSNEPVTISFIDLTGRIIYTAKARWNEQVTVNIRSLSPGIYMIRLQEANETWLSKFVKNQ